MGILYQMHTEMQCLFRIQNKNCAKIINGAQKGRGSILCRALRVLCGLFYRRDGQRVALLPVGERGDAACKVLRVQHAARDGVGEVDRIPAAAEVDLVPCVVALPRVALGQRAGDALTAAERREEGGEIVADARVLPSVAAVSGMYFVTLPSLMLSASLASKL